MRSKFLLIPVSYKFYYAALAAIGLAFSILSSVYATAGTVRTHSSSSLEPVSGVVNPIHSHDHSPKTISKPTKRRPPEPHTDDHHTSNKRHFITSKKLTMSEVETAQECDTSRFEQSGNDLFTAIKEQSFHCVGSLFSRAPENTRRLSFSNENIISVANEAKKVAVAYNGKDEVQYLNNLFYWIRAAYYFENRSALTAENQVATRQAMKALFANEHFYELNPEHADMLDIAMANLGNALIGEHFVPELITLLQKYDESFENVRGWGGAFANASWSILYACGRDQQCRSQFHNSALVTAMSNFIQDNVNWLDTPDTDYHLFNLGYQLTNFYSGKNDSHFTSLKTTLEESLKTIFDDFGPYQGDKGRRAYLASLSGIKVQRQCEAFDLCDATESITEKVLNNRMNCDNDSLFIWAQDMNQEEMAWACSSLGAYEQRFHESLETESKPVIPDDNDKLRMVVFDDAREWGMYGYVLFGASTDNGGLYLEGDPSQAGDQATFFAYENVHERPVFDIWNLRHEYIHYLDGRYISHGDFSDKFGAGRTTWFSEGLAEFISKDTCYPQAAEEAALGSYALSTIFDNEYGVGSDRIYRWGYLAVKYMFEEQHETFKEMIALFKVGKYQQYRTDMVDKWIADKRFDEGFAVWLSDVESTGCQVDTTRPINLQEVQGPDDFGLNACALERAPVEPGRINPGEAVCLAPLGDDDRYHVSMWVPEGLTTLSLQMTLEHGSGNNSLYHRFDGWPYEDPDHSDESSGADKSILITSPQAGWNYFLIDAAPSFTNTTLLVRYINKVSEILDLPRINVSTTEKPGEIRVSWKPVDGAMGYQVFMNEEEVGTTSDVTEFLITGIRTLRNSIYVIACGSTDCLKSTSKTLIVDADSDGDGLYDVEEIIFGTDPLLADTDEDRLSDYEEIITYQTNPLSQDTDKDGILDGDEILRNLDPFSNDNCPGYLCGSIFRGWRSALFKKDQ